MERRSEGIAVIDIDINTQSRDQRIANSMEPSLYNKHSTNDEQTGDNLNNTATLPPKTVRNVFNMIVLFLKKKLKCSFMVLIN